MVRIFLAACGAVEGGCESSRWKVDETVFTTYNKSGDGLL